MTDATEMDVAAARARCEAATEGPWTARHNYIDDDLNEYRDSDICFHPTAKVFNAVPQVLGYVDLCEEDAEFIAHARTDLPAALDEIERLRAALDEARESVRGHESMRWPEEAHRLQQQRNAALVRAEGAEKERDEARAEVERLLDDLRVALPAPTSPERSE